MNRRERPVAAVPALAKLVLVSALGVQIAWHSTRPAPVASASQLGRAPSARVMHAVSFGEPIAASQFAVLYLQAFDNQPGVSVPYRDLDYSAVESWLRCALALDPLGQYPLMMAANLYAQVPDPVRQRQMLDFVHRAFLEDPNQRWRWLAHAAIIAKHRLGDLPLALRYAEDITTYATAAQSWARHMRIFILEDMGEREAATVLLGGLLASGEVTDEAEARFLVGRLEALKAAEKSSNTSKFR